MTNDPIRAKLIELIPSKKWRYTCGQCQFETVIEESPSLADVLRAIERIFGATIITMGDVTYEERDKLRDQVLNLISAWNLATDYDSQTQETKTFLGSLLGVTDKNV